MDHRHLLACVPIVNEAGLPIRVLTPGDFIQYLWPLQVVDNVARWLFEAERCTLPLTRPTAS